MLTRRQLLTALAATAALGFPGRAAGADLAGRRVGLQVGHWRSYEMPDEMYRLRPQTGTHGGGVGESELALDVATRAKAVLEEEGIAVDIIPATVPPSYRADAFVSLHANGDVTGRLRGFSIARASRSIKPAIDDALLESVQESYRSATGLPQDFNISRGMLGYYGFASHRFVHAIAPTTPAVIIEMGFMTNWADLRYMLNNQGSMAWGIAQGVIGFLEDRT